MIEKLGFQAYSVKEYMKDEESIRDSFHKLAAMGYNTVQTARCAVPYEVYGRLAKEAGLEICGTHEGFEDLLADPAKAMENHRILDTKNIGTGGWFAMNTLEDIKDFIKRVNNFAGIIAKEGFKFTYHNHAREFKVVEGKTMMDWLIEGLDPDTTSFCLDTYWVQAGGYDVRHMMERLDGRIDILHLKDAAMKDDWSFQSTEVGNGNLWWDGIIPLAEQIGVKYYVVEQEAFTMNEFDSMRLSSEYLRRYMK